MTETIFGKSTLLRLGRRIQSLRADGRISPPVFTALLAPGISKKGSSRWDRSWQSFVSPLRVERRHESQLSGNHYGVAKRSGARTSLRSTAHRPQRCDIGPAAARHAQLGTLGRLSRSQPGSAIR